MMPQGVFFLAVTGNVECNETLCQQLHGETQNTELTEAGTEAESKASFDARLVLIPLGAVFLGGAGYGGWRLMKYLRDKKRGYVK